MIYLCFMFIHPCWDAILCYFHRIHIVYLLFLSCRIWRLRYQWGIITSLFSDSLKSLIFIRGYIRFWSELTAWLDLRRMWLRLVLTDIINFLSWWNTWGRIRLLLVNISYNLESFLRIASVLILQRILFIIVGLVINSNDSLNFSPFLNIILSPIILRLMVPILNSKSGY